MSRTRSARMDIVVIGAGIVGLTSAHALWRAGHRVTVVDQHDGPAQGCSQANGGFLAPSHCAPWAAPGVPAQALKALLDPQAPMRWRPDFSLAQLRWLGAMAGQCTAARFALNHRRMQALGRYSQHCHERLDAALGLAYDRQSAGVLQLCRSADAQAALQRQQAALRAQGVDAVWRTRDEAWALEPALRHGAPDLLGALHVQGEGSGRCERFSAQLAGHLARQGVHFLWQTRIDGLDVHNDGNAGARRLHALRAQGQSLAADACVVAAGPEAGRLLAPQMKLPLYPVQGHSMTVPTLDAGRAPRHAVLDERSKLAIAPFDGEIRVAGFADVVGHDRTPDPRRCRQLVDGFEALYPGVADTARARFWAGLRPMTPDGVPLIGATGIQGLYLNTGHGTYGWTLSFGSAQLLADIVDGQPTALPAADYALARHGA